MYVYTYVCIHTRNTHYTLQSFALKQWKPSRIKWDFTHSVLQKIFHDKLKIQDVVSYFQMRSQKHKVCERLVKQVPPVSAICGDASVLEET